MNISANYPQDAINLQSVRRALIVKLRHHGDVLLTSPVFQTLKNKAPHIEVDALVYRETQDMLAGHPSIDRLFTIDRGWKKLGIKDQLKSEWELFKHLQSRQYDLLIHLTEHNRGIWLSHLLSPRFSVARKHPKANKLWKRSFTHLYVHPRETQRHTVELNLDAIRRIGIQPSIDERKLILIPGTAAENKIDELLIHHQLLPKQFIHIHPTSRWFFKTWPVEKVAELCDVLSRQGTQIVLTAAPDDRERQMIEAILARTNSRPINLTGQLSLKELAALTAKSKLFIGVDSAPMHIAAAMQVPVVALFGPSGDIEWGPWMVPHRVVASNEFSCRPCGNDGCGGSKISECLTSLPVHRVLDAVKQLSAV
jgi:heptosyltransferase-3